MCIYIYIHIYTRIYDLAGAMRALLPEPSEDLPLADQAVAIQVERPEELLQDAYNII